VAKAARDPTSEGISIEVDGETYRGSRLVSGGGDELYYQEVRFLDFTQRDPMPHAERDSDIARSIARVILRDLIVQWKAQGRRKPVKVEPRKPSRRRRGA